MPDLLTNNPQGNKGQCHQAVPGDHPCLIVEPIDQHDHQGAVILHHEVCLVEAVSQVVQDPASGLREEAHPDHFQVDPEAADPVVDLQEVAEETGNCRIGFLESIISQNYETMD